MHAASQTHTTQRRTYLTFMPLHRHTHTTPRHTPTIQIHHRLTPHTDTTHSYTYYTPITSHITCTTHICDTTYIQSKACVVKGRFPRCEVLGGARLLPPFTWLVPCRASPGEQQQGLLREGVSHRRAAPVVPGLRSAPKMCSDKPPSAAPGMGHPKKLPEGGP